MRRAILKLIHEQSPARPACFDTHAEWVSWLTSAHAAGLPVVRRVDLGKHVDLRRTFQEVLPVGQQAHCSDCDARRQQAMSTAGRCFPVRVEVPAASRAAEDDPQPPAFEISGIATLKRLRVNKYGKDENRVLAIHVDVEFQGVPASVCSYFDELLGAFLWRQEVGGRVVRNASLQPLAYAHRIKGASVEIDGATFHGADASKFVIRPIDGSSVNLACSLALFPGRSNFSDLIARVKDGVRIRITGQPDLFDGEPAPRASRQVSLI